MSKPFSGHINIDIKDSVPGLGAVHPAEGPRGRPERPLRRPRRRRIRRDGAVRRPDRDAEPEADRRGGPHLHELPHDGALLADPLVPDDRPQPHDQRHGRASPRSRTASRTRTGTSRSSARTSPRCSASTAGTPTRRQVALCAEDEMNLASRSASGRSAAASSATTASSAARPTSGIPTSSTTTIRSTPPATPEEGYHLTVDLTDKAIEFIQDAKAIAPDKPFFLYYCPGAAHAPHHVPAGVDRAVQGQVRHGLRGDPRDDPRAPEEARDRVRGHRALADQPVRRRDERRRAAGRSSTPSGRGTR